MLQCFDAATLCIVMPCVDMYQQEVANAVHALRLGSQVRLIMMTDRADWLIDHDDGRSVSATYLLSCMCA
jgi:hypothetical protein